MGLLQHAQRLLKPAGADQRGPPGDDIIAGPRRQGRYRLLALIGATQLIFLLGFTVPVSEIGAHARAWPAAVQERSYLNDHLCGAGTTRACPGPAVPLRKTLGAAGRMENR